MTIQGRRVYPDETGNVFFAPGDYGLDRGIWYGRNPNPEFHLGSFQNHTIVEHEDGTITVSPSILHTEPTPTGEKKWHGFLEKGIWREA